MSKIDPSGQALVYSTYLGGSSYDYGTGIGADAAGNAYVTGYTESGDFPVVAGMQTPAGHSDGFVARLSPSGSVLLYSTYLGGSNYDYANGLAADAAGNAYVMGTTFSDDFPTLNAFQPTRVFDFDVFVTKITPAPTPQLSINNVAVVEGNSGTTNANFTVTLSPASAATTAVVYGTCGLGCGGGSATPDVDYVVTGGTLTFAPGETSKTISVPVIGDAVPEPNETFQMLLAYPFNASIAGGLGVATILNDDGPVGCPASTGAGETFTATVNGGNSAKDWVAIYPAGQTAAWLAYQYVPLPRPSRVTLSAPSNPGSYDLRLFSNDTFDFLGSCTFPVQAGPTLSINDVTIMEGNAGTTNAIFTVTLSPPSDNTVAVIFVTADGTATAGSDYLPTQGLLTFPPGATSRAIAVPVIGDTTFEPDETFFVNLTRPAFATIAREQGVGTIKNDDLPPAPNLAVNIPVATPGQTVTLTVSGSPGNPTDWVGLHRAGDPDTIYLAFQYLNGQQNPPSSGRTSAALTFAMPAAAGTYNFRLFMNGGFQKIATSPTVTVALSGPPMIGVSPQSLDYGNVTPTSFSDLPVTVSNTGGGTLIGTASASAPFSVQTGGSYSLSSGATQVVTVRFSPTAAVTSNGTLTLTGGGGASVPLAGVGATGPSVAAGSATATAGSVLTATVSGGPGSTTDWVALAQTADPNKVYRDWKYLNGLQSSPGTGLTSAVLAFTIPLTPTTGTYEFRFFSNNTFTRLATSGPISVAPSTTPALSVTPPSLSFGSVSTGSFKDMTLTVSNTGGGTLAGSASTSAPFSVQSGGSYSLPSGASQSMIVRYSPTSTIVSSGTLGLTGAAGASVGLSGAGVIGPSLTAATSSTTPGSPMTATVANGPANARDWVALALASDPNMTYKSFQYLNGSSIPPATGLIGAILNFTIPVSPATATYEFRFFSNDSFTLLAKSAAINVAPIPPTVIPNVTTQTSGSPVQITVANGPGSATDWLALAKTTDANGTYTDWFYLNGSKTAPTVGLTAAVVPFTMPAAVTPATYEVRMFSSNSFTRLATSAAITVSAPTNPVLSVTPPNLAYGTWGVGGVVDMTVSVSNTGVGTISGTATTGAPFSVTNGGTYNLAAGLSQTIAVRFSPPGTGLSNGTLTLTGGGGGSVSLSGTGANIPTLTPNVTTTTAGSTVTVTVANGPANPKDWVALAQPTDPITTYVSSQWKYLNNTQTSPGVGVTGGVLTFAMPAVTGPTKYELRFFTNDSFNQVAKSQPITVTQQVPPPPP